MSNELGANSPTPGRSRASPVMLIVPVALSFAMVTAGVWSYHRQTERTIAARHSELSAIAQLKGRQLAAWRRERLADARLMQQAPLQAAAIKDFLAGRTTEMTGGLQEILSVVLTTSEYKSAVLVDPDGRVLIAAPSLPPGSQFGLRSYLKEGLATGRPILSDMHRDTGEDAHIDLVIPFRDNSRQTPIAALVLKINPTSFLIPLLEAWPTTTETGETLLVKREGESVRFLFRLRRNADEPITITLPMDSPELPAAMALRGTRGVVEGIDYRGERVLAALEGVRDSDWHLVAKVDKAEVLSSLRPIAWSVSAIVVLAVLAVSAGAATLWRTQRARHYREQYESERERRLVEESLTAELRRSLDEQARLTAALEQAAEAILITDVSGRVIYANQASARFCESCSGKVEGREIEAIVGGAAGGPAVGRLHEAIEHGESWEGEVTGRCQNGRLLRKDVTVTPVRTRAGHLTNYIAVVRDVTREREVEDQLRQAAKMEAIGRLAGGVAHDFNNLLTAVLGYTEVILFSSSANGKIRSSAEEIRAMALRAAELTKQLLTFGRGQVSEQKAEDLNRIVSATHKMLTRMIGEDIELVLDLCPERLTVRIDKTHAEQILMNLAVNARDAMPNGGVLTIRTRMVETSSDEITLPAVPDATKWFCLEVLDSGCGIEDSVRERIFEPFFTTKGAGKGTGLGLTTVYGIVNQSGGRISVESILGGGTTFRILLPLCAVPAAEGPAVVEPAEIGGAGETILVVEDDASVRRLVGTMLESLGYAVLDAKNPREALSKAAERRTEISLLLTDVVLPEMRGPELARQVGALIPDLRVMYMSGYGEALADTRSEDPDENVVLLQKPFTRQGLAEAIRRSLAPVG